MEDSTLVKIEFSPIQIRIPARFFFFFADIDKLILKFIWRGKEMQKETCIMYCQLMVALIIVFPINSAGEDVETGTLIHCWWEYKLYGHFGKQSGSFL